MKRLASLCLALATVIPGAARAQDDFLAGGIMLGQAVPRLVLFDPPLAGAQMLRVTCRGIVNDSEYARYHATVNGAQVISTFNEQSGLFLRGTEVTISLAQDNPAMPCRWEAVDPSAPSARVGWSYDPAKDHAMTVAAFDAPQRYRVDYNLPTNGCDGGEMTIYEDGREIRDGGGNPMPLLPGSSFLGEGKVMHVVIAGTCPANAFLTGQIVVRP